MNKKILIAVVTLVMVNYNSLFAQKWVYMFEDSKGQNYYYNSQNLKKENNLITVWTKEAVIPGKVKQYREWLLKSRREHKLSTKGYENYSYSITKIQFNIEERKYLLLTTSYYSVKGLLEVNRYSENPDNEWSDIIPDSVIESVFESINPVTK